MSTIPVKFAPKTPNHLALVLGEGGFSSKISTARRTRNADDILKNIIHTARRTGVRYMTLYCLDEVANDSSYSMSHELRVLFYLLLIEADWLEKSEVNMSSSIERPETNNARLARLQLSVVSHLNSGRASQSNVVKMPMARTVQDNAKRDEPSARLIEENINMCDFPDLDLMIFSGGLKRLESNVAAHQASSKTVFVEEYWEDLTPIQFQKILEDHMAADIEFSGIEKQKITRTMVG